MPAPETPQSPLATGSLRKRGRRRLIIWAVVAVAILGGVLLTLSPPSGRIRARNLQASWRSEGDSHYVIDAGGARAFGFDGSGNHVFAPDSPGLNFEANQDFTVEAWIRASPIASKSALQARAWLLAHPKTFRLVPRRAAAWIDAHCTDNDFQVAPIVAKNQTTSILEAVGFQFHLFQGRLSCQLAESPMRPLTFGNFVSPGPDLQDRRWHHVAMTVNRTSPTGGKLYADGVPVLTFDPTKQAGDLSTSEPVRIGCHSNPTLRCVFKGRIGGVALYRRALSGADIAARFRAGPPKR